MRLPLILLTILSCSCSALKLQDSAPALQPQGQFPKVITDGMDDLIKVRTELRLAQLNSQATAYDQLIKEANRLFSKLDGRRRGTSNAAIIAQTGMAAGGIATAALTAAAPQANAVWIQGANAMGTGVNSVRSEFATQRMTAEAYGQTLTAMANDIIEARKKIDFLKAYGLLLTEDQSAWDKAMADLGTGLRELESSVVLKPLTLTVSVFQDKTTSSKLPVKK